MARLRVPASPVKTRPAVSAYASVSNQKNKDFSHDPRSTSPIYLHHSEHASRTSPFPKPSIQSPIKGTVNCLTSMSRDTKRNIQGYIVGQYKAVEKVSHEHFDRTGKKTVFFLGGEPEGEEEVEHLDEVMKADLGAYINEEEDADRSWKGVRDFMRENATLKTGASTKTKAPSLAQCIASANVDDDDSDLDSSSEDDEIDLGQMIEHAISSFSEKTEEYEDGQDDIIATLPTDKYVVHLLPLLSPLEAVDIPYPRKPKQGFGLRRHSGGRSLAFLIARAGDVSSFPEDDDRSLSPSPSPSPSSDENRGFSADDAIDVLRERFRIAHCAGGGTRSNCREWLDAKFEMGCSMVHGPSLLRFVTNCYDGEDETILRVRTSPSKDTLNAKSSARTSIFSKCTSATSMSSYQTRCLPLAHKEHSLRMDALDIDVDEHKCEDGCDVCGTTLYDSSVVSTAQSSKDTRSCSDGTVRSEKRILSLPTLTAKEWSSELRVGEIAQPCVPLLTSAENSREMSPVVMVNETYEVPPVREETVEFCDDVSTGSNDDMGSAPVPFSVFKGVHRKWTSRMKHCLQEMPNKMKQATRDCVKAIKQVSRTAWNFIPAALSSRHPFQKIDSII